MILNHSEEGSLKQRCKKLRKGLEKKVKGFANNFATMNHSKVLRCCHKICQDSGDGMQLTIHQQHGFIRIDLATFPFPLRSGHPGHCP